MKIKLLKPISDFYCAIANEWAVDKDVDIRLFGHRECHVFRPLKTRRFINKLKFGQALYAAVIWLMILLIPIYFFVRFFQVLVLIFLGKSSTFHGDNLVLDFNKRTVGLIERVKEDGFSYSEVANSFSVKNNSFLRYARFFDAVQAFCLSLLSFFVIAFKGKSLGYIAHVMFSFDWLLVYFTLRRISCTESLEAVYFSNHYDRWEFLMDVIFKEKKLCLLQHGILSKSLDLPFPPTSIKKIWCFGESSKRDFDRVFKGIDGVLVEFFSIPLDLKEVPSDLFNVLVVGQPHSSEKEVDLIKLVNKNYSDINIILKPHPVFSIRMYDEVKEFLITDKNFYPKVDAVVCEDSTLGTEYESCGIPVIWWRKRSVEVVLFDVIQNRRNYR